MERGRARPSAPPGWARGAGDGPVRPTSAALGRLWPLGVREVVLGPAGALGEWQARNSRHTLPHCVDQVVASGAVRNMEHVAAGLVGGAPHEGMHFSDSDIYKTLAAAAWDSVRGTGSEVAAFVADVAALMGRAQREDGYLNSWTQGQHPELAWKDLRWGHELYCAGHLVQAAVASERTGGDERLCAVAAKLVRHLLGTFSVVDGDAGLAGVDGHPLVETALVEYYRLTGDEAPLALARRQVELRGRQDVDLPTSGLLGDSRFPLSYFLHHAPVRKRSTATGHAVRELYLQAGVVDVATETGDGELLGASQAIWEDLFGTKTYITGAHGSRHRDESIGDAYELPSDRAYAETCAAIASFQWNWRLLLATGEARYAEAMERVLWNTIAGSSSRQGTDFFYSNTLHLRTDHDDADEDSPRRRRPWYQCACCPPNLARLMASIQAYLVTRDGTGLQLHMPFSGAVSTGVPGGAVDLSVRSGHPWDGELEIELRACSSPRQWALTVRAPEWVGPGQVRMALNGRALEPAWAGRYATVTRRWEAGDRLQLSQPVAVRTVVAHPRIDAVRGCAALQRGPLVYCLEGHDLDGATALEDITLDAGHRPEPTADVPAGLDGYVKVALSATGRRSGPGAGPLYEGAAAEQGADAQAEQAGGAQRLTLVPYFARGNRGTAPMRVWVPTGGSGARP